MTAQYRAGASPGEAPRTPTRRAAAKAGSQLANTMLGVVWVDDFVFHKRVEWHEACSGLAAGCTVCGSSLAAAEVLDELWMDLNRQLDVSPNVEKHQRCKQTVEYAGFLFDTFRGLMLVLEDKQAVLLEQAASLGREGARWSARELDSIKGRLHYSAGGGPASDRAGPGVAAPDGPGARGGVRRRRPGSGGLSGPS
jgi:hypothetical protein